MSSALTTGERSKGYRTESLKRNTSTFNRNNHTLREHGDAKKNTPICNHLPDTALSTLRFYSAPRHAEGGGALGKRPALGKVRRRGAARLGAAPAPLRPALPCPALPAARARAGELRAARRPPPALTALPLRIALPPCRYPARHLPPSSRRPSRLPSAAARPRSRPGQRPPSQNPSERTAAETAPGTTSGPAPRPPPRPARKARSRPAHGRTRSEAPCRAGAAVAAPGIGVVVLRCSARGVARIVKGGKRL